MYTFIGGPFDGAKHDMELDPTNPFVVFPLDNDNMDILVMYRLELDNLIYVGSKSRLNLLDEHKDA